ncbi:histidinol dehydrogenase [Kingella sp. SNUBH-2017]|uniref:histidinol dehydrogenase n=1 Tax=Kingella sp. SNUBH-2017 TaxID=2994077 RepID=UPI0023645A2E|nr:histidinol dehydrogenase [Kingella sp. SNUBH-2017]MDD2182844.1 histidinol dehydrogenase [Kingella sp. SNUBH-2017]
MQTLNWNELNEAERAAALRRPAQNNDANIRAAVAAIQEQVRTGGLDALLALTERFDGVRLASLAVASEAIDAASARVSNSLKSAMQTAKANIERFHRAQIPVEIDIETQAGVRCQQITRPIASVGLYIPGGSAPLFSTVLMLAVPAKIAGCHRITLCSPPPIADEILYAARLCGIDSVYQIGGAQAVFALAYGSGGVPKAEKIFGPGNAYVTEAKRQVQQSGTAIDMPAGPSEVLIIADEAANPAFVAADLLSQAEHGADSQVMLVTPSRELARQVAQETAAQLAALPRAATARQALAHSRIIIAADLAQCVAISNAYAPEHLIVQTAAPRALLPELDNAGSIFLGAYSPESMGDYASGTNHVLPTYGYSKTHSSLGLADFSKRMTVQELSPQGFAALAATVEQLAAAEHLDAHKNAVSVRLVALQTAQIAPANSEGGAE